MEFYMFCNVVGVVSALYIIVYLYSDRVRVIRMWNFVVNLHSVHSCTDLGRVGGLRERDYQLAAQKRNEACRRFDYHCQTAKYFERESQLAHHFNSWNTRDNYSDNIFDSKKSKAESLLRRQNNLRKMLRDEDTDYKNEMKKAQTRHAEHQSEEESVEELRKKLEIKRAERSLYYPHNSRCYQLCNGVSDSVTSSPSHPRHYENERHIDACRNSQVSMEDTNLRNYSSDCQGRKENPDNRHHGEKRHLQGHTMYGTNVDSFGIEFSNNPTKTTGERRHYEAQVDSVDEGTNHHHDRGDDDNMSVISSGTRFRDEQDRSLGFSGQAPISERRHYSQSSADSFRSLANTNLRQKSQKQPVEEVEIEVEAEEEEVNEVDAERETENQEQVTADQVLEGEEIYDNESTYETGDERNLSSSESMGFDNLKNRSTDNINFSWKYDDPAKRPVCFLTHNELVHQIQDLANRELQACKKQNWSEALRLRDMRNRLELQREIEIFNQNDLNMNNETRRSEMMKISDRMKLMDKREACGNQHLVYSEEARTLWETRVREDDKILSKDDRAQREILLRELENEWEAMTLKDKETVAESPVRHQKSHFQEELELTAAAIEKVVDTPHIHASNEDSKNSCTRNKDKAASSLIFLG